MGLAPCFGWLYKSHNVCGGGRMIRHFRIFKSLNCDSMNDLSPFCFLSIEIHCSSSISYKILPYFVYYYYI